MNMNRISARRALAAACISILATTAAVADDAVQGELWETTAQASVPGMPVNMPAYKGKLCQKKEWTTPPETSNDPNQNCHSTNFNHTGSKISWTMVCDNPPMTGEGEINFTGTDAYTGAFTMHAPQFDMQINLTGKKIGTCDKPE
jgi:hypothetical protein